MTLQAYFFTPDFWAILIIMIASIGFLLAFTILIQLSLFLPNPKIEISEKICPLMAIPCPVARKNCLLKAQACSPGLVKKLLEIAISTPLGEVRNNKLFSLSRLNRDQIQSWLSAALVFTLLSPCIGLLISTGRIISNYHYLKPSTSDSFSILSQQMLAFELSIMMAIPALLLYFITANKARNYCIHLETGVKHLCRLPAGAFKLKPSQLKGFL
ncbi:MAG: hypothetical protein COA71_00025 [SAR86 cluster bacterium]|uniref:MotA/TolQ/ExbB proton channel domain-containing protein n=1 Tax=SAR86 cluster bacterium TaxID=2030880 RepID=A0A2A5CHE1_9GAMM|nr:MAG: hypothetical protein COA71_00025 [SAR86 cluster bacterium]